MRQCLVHGCKVEAETPSGLCFSHWQEAVRDELNRGEEIYIVAPARLAPLQSTAQEFKWFHKVTPERKADLEAEGWVHLYDEDELSRWRRVVPVAVAQA